MLTAEKSGRVESPGASLALVLPTARAVADLQRYMQLEPQNAALFKPEANLWASTGQSLPEAQVQVEAKDFWANTDAPLGRLASKSVVSTTTGCWSIIKGRTNKGYVRVYDAHNYGLPKTDGHNFGMPSHRLAMYLLREAEGNSDGLIPEVEGDHRCRNVACCNPYHLQEVDRTENNILKIKARSMEVALAIGQLWTGRTMLEGIDSRLEQAHEEDTGIIVSTRFGPYRLIKLDENPIIAFGQREPCEVFDALLPPSPNVSKRKSRSKKLIAIAGQSAVELAAA